MLTCKVSGKWRILTPVTSKSLIAFKFELEHVPESYTSANFHLNPSREAFPQMGEILRFCDFFLVGWLVVLEHAPRSKPRIYLTFFNLPRPAATATAAATTTATA